LQICQLFILGEYEGQTCYIYDIYGGKTYIDKETLLPKAIINKNSSIYFEYDIEYDEKILKEPDINEFDHSYYYDNDWRGISENSVSDIDSAEILVENIELKENEILDVLPITEDSFGIKKIDLHSLNAYNKFRNKYTNLKELTADDFENYSAAIIYKKGYELNYTNKKEAIEGSNVHYIFSERENPNDSIVLILKPRTIIGNILPVVNNEQLLIPSNQILETYFNISNEIESSFGLDKDILYCKTAKIIKLKNEDYKKFDYIKTPIEENIEPTCWEIEADIDVRNKDYGEVYTYINAITGEVIGAKYIKNNY